MHVGTEAGAASGKGSHRTAQGVMDWLYVPAQYMTGRPDRAIATAAAFALATLVLRLARRRRAAIADRPALLCTALWLFWGINEHAATLYGWNVRADIVFLWPILAAVTVGCVLVILTSLRAAWRGDTTRIGAEPPEPPAR
jgi:hypothetical protein